MATISGEKLPREPATALVTVSGVQEVALQLETDRTPLDNTAKRFPDMAIDGPMPSLHTKGVRALSNFFKIRGTPE